MSSHSASPFNIKVESLTLRSFSREEVVELYAEHTGDTGQAFTPEALDRVFDVTQGQPWLVNALGAQLIDVVAPGAARTITADDVETAREILIQRQDTHLDSLIERLREPRVRQVIEPMLAGLPLGDIPDDDRRFVQDLGLVRRDPAGGLVIANPIYHEVIPRALVAGMQDSLPRITPTIPFSADEGADPLGDYLASLDKVGAYPAQEALPAHEYRIASLPARLAELRAHHDQRFGEVLAAIRAGVTTAWDIAERMTWSRPWHEVEGFMKRAALAEGFAHLRALERRGMVRERAGDPPAWELVAG